MSTRKRLSVKKATRELIAKAGGPVYLAEKMRIPHPVTGRRRKVTRQAIGQWIVVPGEAVQELCKHSKVPLRPEEVRHDLYGWL